MIPLKVDEGGMLTGCGQSDKANLDMVCKAHIQNLELSHLCFLGLVEVGRIGEGCIILIYFEVVRHRQTTHSRRFPVRSTWYATKLVEAAKR